MTDTVRRAHLRCLLATAVACVPALHAQAGLDSARCKTGLTAAAADSQVTRIAIRVSAFDSSIRMSPDFRSQIGQGIRQYFVPPQPLPLATYDVGTALGPPRPADTLHATLTVRGAYRAMLHRDGRFTRVRTVGGTRDAAFDAAIVRAMQLLGDSGFLAAPAVSDVKFSGDSLDVRIAVSPDTFSLTSAPFMRPSADGVTALMRLRLPVRRITRMVHSKPRNPNPRYPDDARRANVEGKTVFEFVVDKSGEVNGATVQVLSAPAEDFVKAVFDVLPKLHFEPMVVEGCAVPVVVEMPFDFRLIRH